MPMSQHCWRFGLSIVLGLELLLTGCSAARPLTYRAAAIHGRIIDAETGQPVKGAAVVALWEVDVIKGNPFVALVERSERLHILEAVTDASGAYTIPAWGPTLLSPRARVSQYEPHLYILKRGYRPKGLNNHELGRVHAVSESIWDGKVIELERPQGPLRDQLGSIRRAYMRLSPSLESEPDWRNYPRATLEAYAEARRLQALGVERWLGLGVVDIERLDKRDREFLRRFEE